MAITVIKIEIKTTSLGIKSTIINIKYISIMASCTDRRHSPSSGHFQGQLEKPNEIVRECANIKT